MELEIKYKEHFIIGAVDGWPCIDDMEIQWYLERNGRLRRIENVPWEVESQFYEEYCSEAAGYAEDLFSPYD